MRILTVDDDPVAREQVRGLLSAWGYEVSGFANGAEALASLLGPAPPPIAILDWMLPDPDGLEICRRVRAAGPDAPPIYLILLTANDRSADLVQGFEAGADDYIVKPFSVEELRARVGAGVRVVTLQHALDTRVRELEAALARVKQLQGLLPICSYCKRIRDDRNYWSQIESYLARHSEARFSHSICPDCYRTKVLPELETL